MAAAEVILVLGRMSDSSDSSRHNLLYLLQNFVIYSTSTCPDLYLNMLKKLVITFQDQLEIRGCPPSFLFAGQVPIPEVDPTIHFPWIKQEQQLKEETLSNNELKKKVSFSTNILQRRKAIIKKDHKCRWCKKTYKYFQNFQKHEAVCSNIPIIPQTIPNLSYSKKFQNGTCVRNRYTLKSSDFHSFEHIGNKPKAAVKRELDVASNFYFSLRTKRLCKIKQENKC